MVDALVMRERSRFTPTLVVKRKYVYLLSLVAILPKKKQVKLGANISSNSSERPRFECRQGQGKTLQRFP
jgi:hypothetical protein